MNNGYTDIKILGIQANSAETKNIRSPLMQYCRVKITGTGSANFGDSGVKVKLYYKVRGK